MIKEVYGKEGLQTILSCYSSCLARSQRGATSSRCRSETGYSSIGNKFLVSKEIVVLRQWEIETGKFGFIKRVDKGRITTVNYLES